MKILKFLTNVCSRQARVCFVVVGFFFYTAGAFETCLNIHKSNVCRNGPHQLHTATTRLTSVSLASSSSSSPSKAAVFESSQVDATEQAIEALKRVLEKEYRSFFDPMEREYYSANVTFDDPFLSLSGVPQYQNNVDMLAGRTFLGSFLFRDAGIVMHNLSGGNVSVRGDDIVVSDITTRWTLRMTLKILPWQPTARFTGISVYNVQKGGPRGVQITHQQDYWDSINLRHGEYEKVKITVALQDFLNQLKPALGLAESAASRELPYELLRRSKDYEVRRYPNAVALQLEYERRDEAFSELGSITSAAKIEPLVPSIIRIRTRTDSDQNTKSQSFEKVMLWPLDYSVGPSKEPPNQNKRNSALLDAMSKSTKPIQWTNLPSCIMAVSRFEDAATEAVVRRVDQELRRVLEQDGLLVKPTNLLQFAQYNAIFTVGKRRGEVWIELDDNVAGNPWATTAKT